LHIDPEKDILNDLFNEIINYNGIPKCLYIQKIEPLGKELSEAVVVSVMTQDEIREKIGLAPLEPGQRVQMDDQTDEMLFAQLEKTGFNANEYEVLDSVNREISCLADAERLENELLNKNKCSFERVLTDTEKSVVDMVFEKP